MGSTLTVKAHYTLIDNKMLENGEDANRQIKSGSGPQYIIKCKFYEPTNKNRI